MTVKLIGIPKDMGSYFKQQIDNEERITKGQISSQAKISAPKISGNYANSIEVTMTGVEANAPYSAWLEYGTRRGKSGQVKFKARKPYATMRLAAKEIANRKGYKYE